MDTKHEHSTPGNRAADAIPDTPAVLVEASKWLHAAFDLPPRTPEAVAMLARVDAAVVQTQLAAPLMSAVRDALAELVACKDLKRTIEASPGVWPFPDADRVAAWEHAKIDYERRQPVAWSCARTALSALDAAFSGAAPSPAPHA